MQSPNERVVGQYPLSIATSLALEGLYKVHPDTPPHSYRISEYKELWVNFRTLFRNYYNAIGRDFYGLLNKDQLKAAFVNEIENLKSVVQQLSPDMKLQIYLSEYNTLHRLFPKAVLREDTTDIQLYYTKCLKDMIKHVLERDVDKEIRVVDTFIDKIPSRAIMFTHAPVDLFVKNHQGLLLLESHTGVLKSKVQWNTKYMNGKSLTQMPFRLDFLTIFGDSETFRPGLMPFRKTLIELSIKYNWTPFTTTDKILLGINLLNDKFLALNLRSIISHR